MADPVIILGRGDSVEWLDNGKVRLTLELDAEEADWYADHLPREDEATKTFRVIAQQLRYG